MIKVSVSNVDSVMARLKKAVEDNVQAQFEEKTRFEFKRLVEVTPQWSGDLAANWRISLNASDGVADSPFKRDLWRDGPWAQMGSQEAVDYAIAASVGVEFSYKEPVYFTNGTPLTFSDNLVSGDGISHAVRPENLIDGRVAMASYLVATYNPGATQ